MTEKQRLVVAKMIARFKPMLGVHGDCIMGDEMFHIECIAAGITPKGRPCNLHEFRARCVFAPGMCAPIEDPLVRNRKIVDDSDAMLACPDGPERMRSGTWMTVRYALKQGKHTIIIMPDGSVKEHNDTDQRLKQVNVEAIDGG